MITRRKVKGNAKTIKVHFNTDEVKPKVEIKKSPEGTFWYHVNSHPNIDGSFNAMRIKDALEAALKQK